MVQLLPELNEGGVERGVVELSRELVARGYRSTVICARGKLCPQIEADGGTVRIVDVCSKNPLTAVPRARTLRRELAALSPSILHVRSRVPGWLVRLANRGMRIPVVSTVHGYNSVSAYSEIMTAGERVICVSEGIKRYVREHYGTPEERLRVIYRGVDLAAFGPDRTEAAVALRREWVADDQRLIVAVGRLTELKGYELLIEAAASLAQERKDFAVVIVGGTREDKREYAASLEALVARHQAPVRFVGSRSDVATVYAAADLLVSCSRKPESFGRTLVEAMALGTPVVAPAHGGAVEIVTRDECGRLFAPGDAEALAVAIREQLATPQPSATALRDLVAANFSLTRMVEQIVAVYEEVATAR